MNAFASIVTLPNKITPSEIFALELTSAFVEMCDDKDVQRLTFDSYLYKRVVTMNPWQQLKLTFLTIGAVFRGNALAPAHYVPVASAVRTEEEANLMLTTGAIKGGIKTTKVC